MLISYGKRKEDKTPFSFMKLIPIFQFSIAHICTQMPNAGSGAFHAGKEGGVGNMNKIEICFASQDEDFEVWCGFDVM
jgi:hypothetical protein